MITWTRSREDRSKLSSDGLELWLFEKSNPLRCRQYSAFHCALRLLKLLYLRFGTLIRDFDGILQINMEIANSKKSTRPPDLRSGNIQVWRGCVEERIRLNFAGL
jgi:hypothetical protein